MVRSIVNQEPALLAETLEWVVLNKPAGWMTIPGSTPDIQASLPILSDWARSRFGPIWVVHRLDLQTTGVLLLARSAEAHAKANAWFAERKTTKVYHCLAAGRIERPFQQVKSHVSGKPSSTMIEAPEVFSAHTFVVAKPLTGRRHQIRIHLSSIGHPILGDSTYGGPMTFAGTQVKRVALHAFQLGLPSGETFQAPLPEDFKQWLNVLRGGRSD